MRNGSSEVRGPHREPLRALGEEIVESEAAQLVSSDDHMAQFGNVLANRVDFLDAVGLDQNRFGRAVVEPVLERVGSEQLRNRQRDRADTIESHVCDRGLGPLRQMHRNHVAALDTQSGHRIGEAPAECAHLSEGIGLDPPLVVFVIERGLIGEVGMAIEAIDGDVVVGGNIPLMTRARLGDALCPVDGLFAKADDAHGGNLRCAVARDRRGSLPRFSLVHLFSCSVRVVPPLKKKRNRFVQFHQLDFTTVRSIPSPPIYCQRC